MLRTANKQVWCAACLVLCCSLVGCGGGYDASKVADDSEAGSGASSGAGEPEVLLEPFDPPTLEELDAKAEWEDQPVLDGLELLRERQAGEPMLVTVQEALSMKNNSDEANEKILSALGKLPASDSDVNWDATIRRHFKVDVKNLNPLLGSSRIEFDVGSLTNFSIFGFDWNFTPFASKDAAVSWQTSKDRMYDKVVLRDDLVWSDGEPITAHDVAFSFQTIMNPRVQIPAVRSGTDQIRWIEAYDDRTLVYFHKESLATNVWNVNFPVIPKHVYEDSIDDDPSLTTSDYHVNLENNPVVGGPYMVSRRTRGQEIVLERRESWYMFNGKQVRPKPFFEEIRYRIIEDDNTALLALEGGDIEEMELIAEFWKTRTNGPEFYKRNTKAKGVEWVTFFFNWNCESKFFDDKRVRQAMSYAFDHKELLDELMYGLYQPCVGPFHPDSWMAPEPAPEPYTRNLDKAEELLAEAGWEDHDGDGILDKEIDGRLQKFEFSILCAQIKERIDICTLLRNNLEQIGITCKVKPVEFTVLQQKTLDHDFDAAFGGWGTGADPDTSENIFGTNQGRNFGNYSNPEVDRLYSEAKKEFDREKRGRLYAQIHEILWEDQPYTWLYNRNSFYGFNKSLRGYNFSPRGPFGYSPGFGSLWKPLQ